MDQHSTIAQSALRVFAVAVLTLSLLPLGGCTICAECEDLAYPAYGGAWQRTRRNEGRVGSLFDPAGAKAVELVDRDTPEEPNAAERARQEAPGDAGEADDETDRAAGDADDDARNDAERDFEDKANELRDLNLDDINVMPGEPVPPTLN